MLHRNKCSTRDDSGEYGDDSVQFPQQQHQEEAPSQAAAACVSAPHRKEQRLSSLVVVDAPTAAASPERPNSQWKPFVPDLGKGIHIANVVSAPHLLGLPKMLQSCPPHPTDLEEAQAMEKEEQLFVALQQDVVALSPQLEPSTSTHLLERIQNAGLFRLHLLMEQRYFRMAECAARLEVAVLSKVQKEIAAVVAQHVEGNATTQGSLAHDLQCILSETE